MSGRGASVVEGAGQRFMSALVDCVFFVVVAILGRERVISGDAVVGILSGYASARFGIAYGKQQTVVAQTMRDNRSEPPPGGGGGTGISGDRYPAVIGDRYNPALQPQRVPSRNTPSPPERNTPVPREDPPERTDRPFDRRSRRWSSTSPLLNMIRFFT